MITYLSVKNDNNSYMFILYRAVNLDHDNFELDVSSGCILGLEIEDENEEHNKRPPSPNKFPEIHSSHHDSSNNCRQSRVI
jgi:hypothetical protein